MDERAVVDKFGERLIIGGDASASGVGGPPRNGAVDAISNLLRSRAAEKT